MKFFKIIVLFLLFTSCAAVHVDYDYDREIDFSKYKTYNYYSDLETGLSELDTKRLLDILDEALKAKGLSLSTDPDFFINIQSSEFENLQRNTVGIGVGGGGGRNVGGGISVGLPIGSQANLQIIFDFNDEKWNGLFWQAVSESRFNVKATPEKREAQLRAIVTKVLEGYPPKSN